MPRVGSWDIFCRVVDNYGDIGVCWRLARQLAAERGDTVRLWVDDVQSLTRIWPDVVSGLEAQRCAGVEILRWSEPMLSRKPHDVVIEAFACKTPDSFAAAMAERIPRSVWINLEYLSAEDWVDKCHLLPSPHPRLPLTKHFFFPGFTRRTGGLLRESGLLERRDTFQHDSAAQQALWRSTGLPPPAADALRVSLFAYANPRAAGLLAAWAGGGRPIACVVPEGVLQDEIAGFFGACPAAGASVSRGNLNLSVLPFLRQDDYDLLLWACDVNFVRGEDSFVRGQWAGRPQVWQIYPQRDDAHVPKLKAFCARYGAGLGSGAEAAVRAMHEAWNGSGDVAAAWTAAQAVLTPWTAGAQDWAAALAAERHLVAAMAEAVENRL